MALIECIECKNKISDQSTSCPKCGYIRNESNIDKTDKSHISSQKGQNSFLQELFITFCKAITFLVIVIGGIAYIAVKST